MGNSKSSNKKAKPSNKATAYDWALPYVDEFVQSIEFKSATERFLDENSVIFDTEEENKFSYTDVHNNYKDLVDNLLVDYLSRIGLNPTQFFESISQSSATNIIQEKVLGLQDFIVFKKQMVKRNMELENMALHKIRKMMEKNSNFFAPPSAPYLTPQSSLPDKQLENNLEGAQNIVPELMNNATTPGKDVAAKEELDEDLMKALEASLVDAALEQNFKELEEARLQEVIAISLAHEKQRLSKMEKEIEKTSDSENFAQREMSPTSCEINCKRIMEPKIIQDNNSENIKSNASDENSSTNVKKTKIISSSTDLAHQSRIKNKEIPKQRHSPRALHKPKSLEKLKPLGKLKSLPKLPRNSKNILVAIEKTKLAIKKQQQKLEEKQNSWSRVSKAKDDDLNLIRRKKCLIEARRKLIEKRDATRKESFMS